MTIMKVDGLYLCVYRLYTNMHGKHLSTWGITNMCIIIITHHVFGSECYVLMRAYLCLCIEAIYFACLYVYTVLICITQSHYMRTWKMYEHMKVCVCTHLV